MIKQNLDPYTAHFFDYAKKMMTNNSKMHEDTEITPDNIYQPAHKENRNLLFEIVQEAHLPGSTILGKENILKLYDLAKQGKACLILSEHVSNLDVPSMFVRFYEEQNEVFKDIFEKLIFIAGVKLNENPLVKLYTEMFTRIVIYPIRSLNQKIGKDEYKEEINLARKINVKSARKIKELRNQGNIFVMYPAGTRYRPWLPETKKGIKEATSYLKSFDYFCCASINGNNMPPEAHEDMTGEKFVKDVMVYSFGEVKNTTEYINEISKKLNKSITDDIEQMKQIIVDNIMSDIELIHKNSEEYRKSHLS